jgi:TP901 family phage tail tape measure protein
MNALFTIGIMLKAIDQASQVFKQMSNNAITEAMKISQKFKELGEKMESLGMKSMANGMMMVAPIQKAVSTFADLEEAQTRLKTTIMDETGKVGEEFKKLQELAARLGTELPGSTKDMIEMFIALREQGVQTQYILGGVGEAAAKFAVLMKLPFKEAATYVAKFQEAMGVADKDMIKFMDLLQRLKYASGIEVQDLYYTFKYLGPSLKTLKLQGLEAAREISAVIGVLAASGIEGSTAGTNLAMALTKMADASHKLDSKRIKELVGPILDAKGIKLSFFDEKGEFKGIKAMVAELEKLKVLSSQERLLVLSKLFGEEAARPLSVLIDKGVEGYEEMLKRIEKQADMQKKINAIMATHKQKWDTLAGTVQNAVAYFGGATAKALQLGKVFEFLNDVFDKLNDFMTKHEKLTGILGAGIAVAGGALIVVGGGLMLLGAGVKLLGSGIDAMQTGIKAMKTFASWTVTARKELLRLIGVQKLMEASQYHGGFGKALSFWLNNTKLRILEATSAMKDWIVAQLKAFRTHFLTLTGLKNLARAFGVALVNALRAAIVGIRALGAALLTNPIGWVGLAIGTAAFLIYKYWEPISGFFKGLWRGIKESLKGLEPAWDGFKRAGKLLEPVLNALKGIYNFVKNLFKPVDDTGKAAENLGLRFGKAIGNFISHILDVKRAFNWLKTNISEFYNWTSLPSKLFEGGKKLMEYFASGIMSAINKPIEAVKALAQKIRNFFPFSPAKEGPLRDLHKIKLMETIAQSLSPSPVLQALYKMTSAIKSSLLSLPMPVLTPALAGLSIGGFAGRLLSASQGSPTPVINLHQTLNISGNVDSKSAKEIANTVSLATKEAIFKAIDEYFRRKARPEWK